MKPATGTVLAREVSRCYDASRNWRQDHQGFLHLSNLPTACWNDFAGFGEAGSNLWPSSSWSALAWCLKGCSSIFALCRRAQLDCSSFLAIWNRVLIVSSHAGYWLSQVADYLRPWWAWAGPLRLIFSAQSTSRRLIAFFELRWASWRPYWSQLNRSAAIDHCSQLCPCWRL